MVITASVRVGVGRKVVHCRVTGFIQTGGKNLIVTFCEMMLGKWLKASFLMDKIRVAHLETLLKCTVILW